MRYKTLHRLYTQDYILENILRLGHHGQPFSPPQVEKGLILTLTTFVSHLFILGLKTCMLSHTFSLLIVVLHKPPFKRFTAHIGTRPVLLSELTVFSRMNVFTFMALSNI